MRYTLTAEMDDGRTLVAVADGRDFVAAEAKGMFDDSPAQVTRIRFLAWHALTRTEQIKSSWEKFNTRDCENVQASLPEAAAAGVVAESLDPGRTDQSVPD